jgi:Na+-transporting methylmalonyl-CoA/oxaloacetate decarboxylase gamma subunit
MYWEYVAGGYGFVFVALALYTGWVLRMGRLLSRKVPPERRRFLD